MSSLHFINAGREGLLHFAYLLNCVIADVNNGKVEDLNQALGIILYKGHHKNKNSHRSYRTISTCPVTAKALDLYIRDLFQASWDACTATTQYQTAGSSHELASLLITEVVQYSLNIADQPVFLLVLDAQSAFDRCLRQILCSELFRSGVTGSALLLINNRLENRSTVYKWDGEMLGPAQDITGFEQGGINSGDYYKLYNNTQLIGAQSSYLGVNIGSSTISAVGQADDVILAANSVHGLQLLAHMTENYCSSYRVKLVPSKTKLLPLYHTRHEQLVEYTRLVNPVTIESSTVEIVEEAEHVGVIRSVSGNMPHLMNRISCHKKAIAATMPAGMARGHRGTPAASLRVHTLYVTPVLLCGVASLVLSPAEITVMSVHYKSTIQKLQRLHNNSPRAVVFFLAGCLPFEAVLHQRQLGLFSMLCHLPQDPLHQHAKFILTSVPLKARSWCQHIRQICQQYGLPCPLRLLSSPIKKEIFKEKVKVKIAEYWHALLRTEAKSLKKLQYFKPELYSLTKPHYIWVSAASNPYECSKSTVLARMVSGRYRTETLCRYWSDNKGGYCRAPTCYQTPGTLEHLLIICPALDIVRERLYTMWLENSVMYPALHSNIRDVLESDVETKVQFILEPLAFTQVAASAKMHGARFIQQLAYLTRTFAFYMHREYDKLKNSLKNNPPPPPNYSDSNPSLISAVPNYQTQPVTSSTCRVDCPAQLTGPQCYYHQAAQPGQSVHLTSRPCLVSPSCVGPVTAAAAPTSITCSDKPNPSIILSSPSCDMACVTSMSGANNVIDTVYQVVPSNQCQYQDCSVGFCGRCGSHDHTMQVSSQSHI